MRPAISFQEPTLSKRTTSSNANSVGTRRSSARTDSSSSPARSKIDSGTSKNLVLRHELYISETKVDPCCSESGNCDCPRYHTTYYVTVKCHGCGYEETFKSSAGWPHELQERDTLNHRLEVIGNMLDSLIAENYPSRSVQRRVAVMQGKPMPTFSTPGSNVPDKEE